MEPIQLFVPRFRVDETLAEIRECLEKGWTGLGFKTFDFEAAWIGSTGLAHAHFLSSATAGLHLALCASSKPGTAGRRATRSSARRRPSSAETLTLAEFAALTDRLS